jgi:hypothetical protein
VAKEGQLEELRLQYKIIRSIFLVSIGLNDIGMTEILAASVLFDFDQQK